LFIGGRICVDLPYMSSFFFHNYKKTAHNNLRFHHISLKHFGTNFAKHVKKYSYKTSSCFLQQKFSSSINLWPDALFSKFLCY